MFETITPEQAGLSSARVRTALETLEKKGHNFHSVLMMRHGHIFAEAYWAPFTKERPHRMYSITKSFVGVAIGVLVDRGLVDLDRPFVSYFPEYDNGQMAPNLKKQTIRHMLTMTTAAQPGYWFSDKPEDRLAHYLSSRANRLPGGWYDYDSEGSFALGCLVEKISGQTLLDFMREAFLNDIGFGADAKMLYCPGGHMWGDSSMICTTRELALFAQLVANKGRFNGKQLISEAYMTQALATQSDPQLESNYTYSYGYGYQIWKPRENMFSFNGMGSQFVIAYPEKDIIFVCTSDNQSGCCGFYNSRLFDVVMALMDEAADQALRENPDEYKALTDFSAARKLRVAKTTGADPYGSALYGKTFRCGGNPMGWKWFRFEDSGEEKVLHYENAQGQKALRFKFGENVFQKFPQEGYSDVIGTKPGASGHLYDCAVSAGWCAGRKLDVFVQVIDEYFGRLNMCFCFPDENSCDAIFTKSAEDFFNEYKGHVIAFADETVS